MNIKLQQQAKAPIRQQVDKRANWIIIMPHLLAVKTIRQIPYGDILQARRQRLGKKDADKIPITLDLPNARGSHVSFACIKSDISSFDLLTLARKLVSTHEDHDAKELGIAVHGFSAGHSERIAEAMIAAVLASAAEMPRFKSKSKSQNKLQMIYLYGVKTAHEFKRTFAEAEGNALARGLSILPSNMLTPSDYLKRIRQLANENKWKLEFYDIKSLKKQKAGAFLAVTQGSPTEDAGIVRLQYTPSISKSKGKLALVGKGICYDTGGVNLKSANYMFGMHEDMQGSAVALGTLLALTQLKVNFPVECWMALAMNHIGPRAYKPNDVITASDGTTIEVVNTDAEGRMILADTLAMASKQKPKLIIDYATLTGACIYSLGKAYSGIFTNKDELIPKLVEAGRDSGERVWPFPMDEDYDKLIESDIADVKQCSRESGVDHILAARFLQRFVKNNTPWIHIDLASSNRKGGLAHIPTDTTGFGVRYSLNLLLDKKLSS
ncbi:MAG: leucyl aminopeptidase family protein [Gammaproteobacteria bacterium]|nr:leucyl aminopeptidase family protein [Gammaproteobacteria bacterium]